MAGKTSSKAASAAARVLQDKNATSDAKTAAASALAQVETAHEVSEDTRTICLRELQKAVVQYADRGLVVDTPDGIAYLTVCKGKGWAEIIQDGKPVEVARI